MAQQVEAATCQWRSDRGSSANPMQRSRTARGERTTSALRGAKHPLPQEVEPGSPIHLAFDGFEPVDLPLHRAGAPAQRQRGADGRQVPLQSVGKAGQPCFAGSGEPAIELVGLLAADDVAERANQMDDALQRGGSGDQSGDKRLLRSVDFLRPGRHQPGGPSPGGDAPCRFRRRAGRRLIHAQAVNPIAHDAGLTGKAALSDFPPELCGVPAAFALARP